ncbi:Uncharacterised protein [Mycobacteroides abscessus subsp. abscessus]|nr:Uncharacterised protein [Mycobacteroides abscessus subsp. abscessus]
MLRRTVVQSLHRYSCEARLQALLRHSVVISSLASLRVVACMGLCFRGRDRLVRGSTGAVWLRTVGMAG